VKSLVFGGLDGIITTFAVVAASVGGSLNSDVILLMGFANLIADGLSMGFGDYLSSQARGVLTTLD
jgi:VIT1/CCC1 family predicted Fe2+/Mn2+ transporter